MNRNLLFTAVALGLTIFMAYSFSSGPSIQATAGNRSGSAGSQANCNGPFCHGGIATSTFVGVTLTEGGTPVTKYRPNQTYQVVVAGATTTGNRPGFGFQCSAVKESSTSTQAGTFNVGSATNIAVRTSGTISLVEHTAELSGIGAGNNWTYQSTFNWTAPAAGTGNIKFFLTLLSSNSNAAATGDSANAATAVFTEAPLGVEQTPSEIKLSAYPNPATHSIILDAGAKAAGRYNIVVHNATGQRVLSQTLTHNAGAFNTYLPCGNWAPGTYFLQLQSVDGTTWSTSIVKQ